MKITDIEEQWPFLNLMHPAHLRYIKDTPINTLQYFLRTLYEIEPEKRHKIVSAGSFFLFSNIEDKEEYKALYENKEKFFEEFAFKCIKASEVFSEVLIVMAINQCILHQLSNMGDKTNVDTVKNRLVGLAEHLLRKYPEDKPEDRKFVDDLVDNASNLDETTEENYNLYVYFCENVLKRLEEEREMWTQQWLEKYSKENEEPPDLKT